MALIPKLSAILGLNNVGNIIPSFESPIIEWKIPDFYVTLEHFNSIDSPPFYLKNRPMKIKLFHSGNKNNKFVKWFELCLLHADDLTSMLHLIQNVGIQYNNGLVYKQIAVSKETHGVRLLKISEYQENKLQLVNEGHITFFLELFEFLSHNTIIHDNPSSDTSPSVSVELSSTSNTIYNQQQSIDYSSSISMELSSASNTIYNHQESKGLHNLSLNLEEMYLKEMFCDLIINVSGQQFKCHKCVLSARSKVFAKNFDEMADQNFKFLDVTVCKSDIFQQFILYLYTGKIQTLSDTNVIGLYTVSKEYDVNDLVIDCINYMKSHISVDLFCDFFILATKNNESDLLTISKAFFVQNTKSILSSEKWIPFLTNNPKLGNELYLLTLPDN